MKDTYLLTLECQNPECFVRMRVGRILSDPNTRVGALQFCPVCGSKAFAHTDNMSDYWESMSKSFGMPIEALQLLHTIWEPHEEPSFKKFAEKTWKAVGTT